MKNTLVEETVVERNGIDFKIKKKIEGQHVIKDIYFNDKGEDFHFFEKLPGITRNDLSSQMLCNIDCQPCFSDSGGSNY